MTREPPFDRAARERLAQFDPVVRKAVEDRATAEKSERERHEQAEIARAEKTERAAHEKERAEQEAREQEAIQAVLDALPGRWDAMYGDIAVSRRDRPFDEAAVDRVARRIATSLHKLQGATPEDDARFAIMSIVHELYRAGRIPRGVLIMLAYAIGAVDKDKFVTDRFIEIWCAMREDRPFGHLIEGLQTEWAWPVAEYVARARDAEVPGSRRQRNCT